MTTDHNDTADEATILNTNDQDRSGQISEGELDLARSLAKRVGWVPEKDWTRPNAKWVDADVYLTQLPAENEKLRGKIKDVSKGLDVAMDNIRKQARAEAEARVRQAAQSGDADAAAYAAQQYAEATKQPDPQVNDWMARNSWFLQDRDATDLAQSVAEKFKNSSTADQLEKAELAVRAIYPQYFDEVEKPSKKVEREVDEEREEAPRVQPGTRQATPRYNREKSWTDLPKDVKSAMNQSIERMVMTFKVDPEKKRAELAKAYWEENNNG